MRIHLSLILLISFLFTQAQKKEGGNLAKSKAIKAFGIDVNEVQGNITDHFFTAPYFYNASRVVRVYTPPNYRGIKSYPVMYIHDGQNIFYDSTSYLGEWYADEIMDSLCKAKGFECILVAIDHLGEKRMQDFNPWDNMQFGKGYGAQYIDWIVQDLKPFIDRNYNTLPDASNTGLIGASLGATITHYAALKYPNTFGKIAIYSPSYWVSDQELKKHTLQYSSAQKIVAEVLIGREGLRNRIRAKRQAKVLASKAHITITHTFDRKGKHNEKLWTRHFAETVQHLMAN